MKKIITAVLLFVAVNLSAQNVGIGTNTPTRPLSFPPLLGKKISLYPGSSGDAGFGVFGNELRLHSDYSGADITFGYDDYVFGFTERMRVRGNGNVGIGNPSPAYPLSFNGTLGDKISLWTDGSPSHYGFGIQASLFQIFTKTTFDDIAFGYGNSSLFGETMRIKGNGKVGIGTNNPTEKLQVAGNIKADSLKYTTPRITYHSIPGAAFRAERSTDTSFVSTGSGGAYLASDVTGKRLTVAVQLPHKAVMQTMTVHMIDNSAFDDLQVVFRRKLISDNFFADNIGNLSSSGASAVTIAYSTPVNSFASSNVVDNTLYTYYITVGTTGTWSGSSREVRSIVITYTMGEPIN